MVGDVMEIMLHLNSTRKVAPSYPDDVLRVVTGSFWRSDGNAVHPVQNSGKRCKEDHSKNMVSHSIAWREIISNDQHPVGTCSPWGLPMGKSPTSPDCRADLIVV